MGVTAIVLALSAAQGTGKTALASQLAGLLGGTHASVSGYLTSRLLRDGRLPSPELLRLEGAVVAEDPAALVRECLAHCGWTRGTSLVFDSIRHRDVLVALRREVAPQEVIHVGLRVPETVRLTRLRSRGREPLASQHEAHSTEIQVPTLVTTADAILDATAPVDQMVSEVLAAVRR